MGGLVLLETDRRPVPKCRGKLHFCATVHPVTPAVVLEPLVNGYVHWISWRVLRPWRPWKNRGWFAQTYWYTHSRLAIWIYRQNFTVCIHSDVFRLGIRINIFALRGRRGIAWCSCRVGWAGSNQAKCPGVELDRVVATPNKRANRSIEADCWCFRQSEWSETFWRTTTYFSKTICLFSR